jgi:hypothetical protein
VLLILTAFVIGLYCVYEGILGTNKIINESIKKMETITKIKVIRILKNHGHNNYNELKDFIKDLGNKEIYKLQQERIG